MTVAKNAAQLDHDELIGALERFAWIAEDVRDEVHRADVDELRGVLEDSTSRVSAKERALVTLGLLASARAQAALGWFDPAGAHRRVRLAHRLARRACARRRGRGPMVTGKSRRAA